MSVIGTSSTNKINVSNVAGQSIPNSNLTSPSGAPAHRPQQFYNRIMLEYLRQSEFKWDMLAERKSIPRNAGTNTVNFRRIKKLVVGDTTNPENTSLRLLTEGVTPNGRVVDKESITATVAQYGDFIAFSDKVDFEEIDPIIAQYTTELGYSAKELMDLIVRDMLVATPTVKYAQVYAADGSYNNPTMTPATNPVVSRDKIGATNKFNLRDIRKILRDFKKNHVRPAYKGDYVCFIGPDTEFDLMDDPTFQKRMDYGRDIQPMMDNEIGRIFGCRFIVVKNPKIYKAGVDPDGGGPEVAPTVDVHAAIVMGAGALGVVDVESEGNVETIIKGLGSAGTEDPLNQRQTIGYKINAFGAVRLQDLAVVRYEHAVSV